MKLKQLAALFMAGAMLTTPVAAMPAGVSTRAVQADTIQVGDMTIQVEEDVMFSRGDDGFYYLYPDYEGIPYVMFGTYDLTEDVFFEAFTNLMKDNYEDLVVTQEPEEITAANGRVWHRMVYEYTVSGFTVVDTRVYAAAGDTLYMFGSKEVPEIDYTVGDLLYEAIDNLEIQGDEGNKGTGNNRFNFGRKTEDPKPQEQKPQEIEENKVSATPIRDAAIAAEPVPMTFQITSVLDAGTKRPVGRIFAPEGFTVNNSFDYFVSGPGYPIRQTCMAASQNGDAVFLYQSGTSYIDNESWLNGTKFEDEEGTYSVDFMAYTFRTRDAASYCDFYRDQVLVAGLEPVLVEEWAVPEEEQMILDEKSTNLFQQLSDLYKTTGSGMVLDSAGYTEATRLYALTLTDAESGEAVPYYMLVQAVVMQTQASTSAIYGDGGNHSSTNVYGYNMQSWGFNTQTTYRTWGPVSTYAALVPAEQFNELFPAYRSFVLNTGANMEFGIYLDNFSAKIATERGKAQLYGYNANIDYDSLAKEAAEETLLGDTYHNGEEGFTIPEIESLFYVTLAGGLIKLPASYAHAFEDKNGDIFVTCEEVMPEDMKEMIPANIR